MLKNNLADIKTKIINHIIYAMNSVLLSFITIIIHRNFIANKNQVVQLFSVPRIILFVGMSICYFLFMIIITTGEPKTKIGAFFRNLLSNPVVFVVLATLAFRMWYFSFYTDYTVYYDSKTYINYPYNILLGQTDIFRTPVYPYFIKLIEIISGTDPFTEPFYIAIANTQFVMSLISVVVLYYGLIKFFKNKYIAAAASAFYGCTPAVFTWDSCTLTESISLACIVVFLYFVFSYLAKPSKFYAVILGLYAFVMVMVRPTFIYIYAVLGVFFVARWILTKNDRRQCITGIVSLAAAGVLLLGYCGLNYKNYEYFTISSVSKTVNQLYIVMSNGIVKNDDYPDISEYIYEEMTDPTNENWITNIIEPLPGRYSYQEIDDYVTSCISKNRDVYNTYTLNKITGLMDEKFATQYIFTNEFSESFNDTAEEIVFYTFPFSFKGCLILVGIGILWTLLMMIIKRRVCWQVIGLSAIIFSHIFVSVYGSMAEFQRLSAMAIPAVLVLIFYFADYIFAAARHKKVFYLTDNESSVIKIK